MDPKKLLPFSLSCGRTLHHNEVFALIRGSFKMFEGKNHEMEQQMEWNSSTLPLSAEEYLQKQQTFIENYKWLVNSFLAVSILANKYVSC